MAVVEVRGVGVSLIRAELVLAAAVRAALFTATACVVAVWTGRVAMFGGLGMAGFCRAGGLGAERGFLFEVARPASKSTDFDWICKRIKLYL